MLAARKRLAQEETKLAGTKREEQRKEGRKTILSVEGGVESILQDHLFRFVVSFLELSIKPHPWLGVEKLWIFARIATWHLHVDEASKKSKGAKVEEDEELS